MHVYEDKPTLVQTKNPALGNGYSTITLNLQCGCSEHALFPALQAATGGWLHFWGAFKSLNRDNDFHKQSKSH